VLASFWRTSFFFCVTAIAQTLDTKLKQWRPATARKVVRQVTAIIRDAEQESRSSRPVVRRVRRLTADPFLSDKKLFTGRTPSDLAAKHDRYLYDM
jgi:hypothetical protein